MHQDWTAGRLTQYTERELLQMHGEAIDELLRREVVEARSNPIGGYAEWLVCNTLGLTRARKGQKNIDATKGGTRYQIKARRELKDVPVVFGAIKELPSRGFDHVIAIAFDKDYSVAFALKLAHASIAPPVAHWSKANNGWVLSLRGDEGGRDGVEDISHRFR